jgi:RNA polymerase sigma factor (sigma-70 family)
MNALRKRYRRSRLALRKVFAPPDPVEPFSEIDDREELLATLASLTPRQRAALVLTEILGYSSEEAAKILGVQAMTVRSLASRGREAVRQTVGERT